MRVYFVTDSRHLDEEMLRVDDGSLLLIGHEVGARIDLVAELNGTSDSMKRLSDYSKRRNLVIFCGIEATIYRRHYLSTLVIDRGHIMGVSDSTHSGIRGEDYNLGSSYRVYDTSLGMVGTIVGSDIYYPETLRTVCRENIGYIVELAGGIRDKHAEMIQRTGSYLNGIYILSIVDGVGRVTDREGETVFKTDRHTKVADILVSRDKTLTKGIRYDIYDNVYVEK